MALDPILLDLLACPGDDHAPLRPERREEADVLVCTACESSFPIEDGIPVLLVDEATPGPRGVGLPADGSDPAAWSAAHPPAEPGSSDSATAGEGPPPERPSLFGPPARHSRPTAADTAPVVRVAKARTAQLRAWLERRRRGTG